jgi:hypothetical protein
MMLRHLVSLRSMARQEETEKFAGQTSLERTISMLKVVYA